MFCHVIIATPSKIILIKINKTAATQYVIRNVDIALITNILSCACFQ